MGAWGPDGFENDTALDFAATIKSVDDLAAAFVAKPGKKLDADRACIIIAAAECVAAMLGRPHSVRGTIARGDRMGQRLGWPTANLEPEGELVPHDGVYATRSRFAEGEFDSVTNIGTRPTVYENYRRVVESHILGFAGDAYERPVELFFYKRLREERIFPTVMDLSAQIGRDVEATREFFAARRRLEESGSAAEARPYE